jgi:enoyl-CoA hydratase/carnithine racemase
VSAWPRACRRWRRFSGPSANPTNRRLSDAEIRLAVRSDIGLDPDIYVAIVTGAGEAFCAGRDVKFLASYQAQGKRTPHEDPNSPLYHWGGGGQPSDANLEKPLIAAINGLAVGVGLSLALQCQLRVMAETRLDRRHPHQGRTAGLGAQSLHGAAAHDRGLSHLVQRPAHRRGMLPPGDRQQGGAAREADSHVRGDGRDDLRQLAARRAGQVRLYRLAAAFRPSLVSYARDLDQFVAESEDGAEGPRAFREKRKPVWKMR